MNVSDYSFSRQGQKNVVEWIGGFSNLVETTGLPDSGGNPVAVVACGTISDCFGVRLDCSRAVAGTALVPPPVFPLL